MITALALSGSSQGVLYAGTVSAWIFVSSDGGATVAVSPPGLLRRIPLRLAVDGRVTGRHRPLELGLLRLDAPGVAARTAAPAGSTARRAE
jgi:hypothetical protein